MDKFLVASTHAAILSAFGFAIYDRHPKLIALTLVALMFYSRWEIVETILGAISQFALTWDERQRKFQLKVIRDLKTGKPVKTIPSQTRKSILGVEIRNSTSPRYLSEAEVFELVRKLPHVQDFMTRVSKPIALIDGPEPITFNGNEHATFSVQVAEDLNDHLSTFDLLYIDAKDGTVLSSERKR